MSIISNNNFSTNVEFILKEFESGEILIYCTNIPEIIPFYDDKWLNQIFSLQGITDSGYNILCPKLALKEGNTSFTEQKSRLLFIAKDDDNITLEKNVKNDVAFQKCVSGISNYNYSGVMHQIDLDASFSVKIIKSEFVDIDDFSLKRGPIFSGEWVFEGYIDNFDQIRSYITGLNVLSSLLTCEDIDSYYLDCYQNGEITRTILFPNRKTNYHSNLNVVHVADPFGRELSEIINETFPNYIKLNDALDLSNLIFFKRKSEQSESDEIMVILGVIAIETICSQFEKFLKTHHRFNLPKSDVTAKINSIKKQMHKHHIPDNVMFVKELSEKLPGFPSLRDKLRTLCNFNGIKYSDDDLNLVTLRNEMIHYGKSKSKINLLTEKNRLSDFISRICLTLLNYEGKYYSLMEDSYIEFEKETPKPLSEILSNDYIQKSSDNWKNRIISKIRGAFAIIVCKLKNSIN